MPAGDRRGRPRGARRAGGRRVLDALDRHAGEAELLHHAHARHRRREDMSDVGRVDVLEAEPGVVEGRQAGVAAQVTVVRCRGTSRSGSCRRRGPRRFSCSCSLSTGRKRTMTTSLPFSSRSASSSPTSGMPTRKSSCLPGERHLHARPFRQVDLADAVAVHVLDVRRAEERHVHEGVAVERRRAPALASAVLRDRHFAHTSAPREEVLAAVAAAGAEHLGRCGGIVRDREVPGFQRNAETNVGHDGRGD